MRKKFTYVLDGHTCQGLITCEDALLGPIIVYPDQESAFTYAAGYSQAGSDAVLLHQQIDGKVEMRHLDDQEVEGFLLVFVEEWLPDRGNLQSVVKQLLAEYLC
jgi:hypothetical protein